MITMNPVTADLAAIAEQMSMVVDAQVRARLSGEYLELLQEYHGTKTPSPALANKARALLAKTVAGRRYYKLMPGFGTISEKFYKAYDDAVGSLKRLAALSDRAPNAVTRAAHESFLRDIGSTLDRLMGAANFSSANANLSRLDALASQVNNLIASQMIPAEIAWSKALGAAAPSFLSTGQSGAISKSAQPGWFARTARPATILERQRPYFRPSRVGAQGAGPAYATGARGGLGDFWSDMAQTVTGIVTGAKESATASADAVKKQFEGVVLRVKFCRERAAAQNAAIENARQRDPERATGLSSELAARVARLKNFEAELNGVAAEMKLWSVNTLDYPGSYIKTQLGQLGQTSAIAGVTVPATWLAFAERIADLDRGVAELQAAFDEADRAISGWSAVKTAAAVGGAGMLVAAAAVGAVLLLKGRR